MPIFLHGISLRFFRGIGSEKQSLAPFKEFNLFIGANNSGKSTILDFLSRNLPFSKGTKSSAAGVALDQYRGQKTGEREVELAVPRDHFLQNCLRNIHDHSRRRNASDLINRILDGISDYSFIWVKVGGTGRNIDYSRPKDFNILVSLIGDGNWQWLWTEFNGMFGGDLHNNWIPQTLTKFLELQIIHYPTVRLIPAIRQIGPKGSNLNDFSGQGLIDKLAEIQSPDHDKRKDREIFEKVNEFLQIVTGKNDARIEIPHHREHILVHMDDKVLPLSQLGTGIHEVIMIAAFCTISEGEIICMEEPELHLHPLLQRKLLLFLQRDTKNQYFIATHSASFIDTPGAAIFHVTNDGDQTRINETLLRRNKYNICHDLGYKASDLTQANSVIWVEGPSDRIYIKHWIKHLNENLIEGVHYSIMFYGGRLLSHLSVNHEDVDSFIDLRSLNHNLALMIDSDKSGPYSKLNETKQRLQAELGGSNSICWITKGREVENYIDHGQLHSVIKSLYPSAYDSPCGDGAYEHALYFNRIALKNRRSKNNSSEAESLIETNIDKVKVARLVCEHPANLDILDLRARIKEVVEMIIRANHL